MNDFQVDALLKRVDMNHSFLDMANNDQELINLMKETIIYQHSVLDKRQKLVYAITHNVEYLAYIHK